MILSRRIHCRPPVRQRGSKWRLRLVKRLAEVAGRSASDQSGIDDQQDDDTSARAMIHRNVELCCFRSLLACCSTEANTTVQLAKKKDGLCLWAAFLEIFADLNGWNCPTICRLERLEDHRIRPSHKISYRTD
ncbi:MAG: hypothetical protein CM1200mP29_01600 [Verrucomicrobiota bacterium]|nr:MAG: hypothetical protein CM1200mP29_01600 [Verrucomicrobiota bacterium]